MKIQSEADAEDFLEVIFMYLVSQAVMEKGIGLKEAKESVRAFMESPDFISGLLEAKYNFLTKNN